MALDGPCSVGLTPYQEVASGYENEKFNGDYGTGIPPLGSFEAEVTLDKTSAPSTVPLNTITTFTMPFANTNATTEFGLGLSTGGTTPLVVTDACARRNGVYRWFSHSDLDLHAQYRCHYFVFNR